MHFPNMSMSLLPTISNISQSSDSDLPLLVSLALFGCLLCLCILVGNSLVICLVLFDPYLQQSPQHVFIASLALADLLLGVLILPLSLTKLVLNGRWVFGSVLCPLYLSVDVLLCTASILHLCVISLDRYLSIRYPLRYLSYRTRPRLLCVLALVWILSWIISLPSLLFWSTNSPESQHGYHPQYNPNDLECELPRNLPLIIFSSMASFFVPLVVIVVLYFHIFKEARRHLQESMNAENLDFLIQHSLPRPADVDICGMSAELHEHNVQELNELASPTRSGNVAVITSTDKSSRGSVLAVMRRRRRQKRQRERRTTLVVLLILGAFVLCWLPFFTLLLVQAWCEGCVSHVLYTVAFWLGYCNSTFNPIIYTVFNPEYRAAFRRLLCSPGEAGRRASFRG